MRGYVLVGCTALAFSACGGGGGKKTVKKPVTKNDKPVKAKKETEEDRAAKRLEAAHKIIPDGSSCLPASLKEENAPRLELAAAGQDALICAIDANPDLLGPVGCWKIDLATGGLAYKSPEALPGRGFAVGLDDRCARGYCLPKEVKTDAKGALIAWEAEGKKVAVLVGDDVHLFDGESKEHESSFSIKGEKGVTNTPVGLYFVSGTVAVEGKDDGANSNVWTFKADGTAQGAIASLGGKEEKPLSTYKGSVSVLDKGRLGISERGMETMTIFEVADGKRSKLVRNAKKAACKPAELDAFWHDGEKVSDKCKGSVEALSGHLMGATAVAGAKNFLVLLRGDRLGELGVLDAKTLAEKKAIKMPWCTEGGEGGGGGDGDKEGDADEKADKADAAPPKEKAKSTTRGAKTSSDPEEGGE